MASVQTSPRTHLPGTAIPSADAAMVAEARATTQGAARTFSIACRMLPRALRDDVYLLYLVFRTLDDLVDDGRPEAAERVEAVASWAAGGPGDATREVAILRALAARHPLPKAALADFVLIDRGLFAIPPAQIKDAKVLLTVVGGYLFGWIEGSAYVLIATTLAATAVFMLARSALGEPLRARAGPALVRFADGFRSNALSYVFVLHLVPIFPYAMVIGIPAACGVRVQTFVISAFLGLLPGTLLLAHLGSGLGELQRAGLPIGIESLLRPEIVLPLLGLAVLALLPVAYRSWQARRTS